MADLHRASIADNLEIVPDELRAFRESRGWLAVRQCMANMLDEQYDLIRKEQSERGIYRAQGAIDVLWVLMNAAQHMEANHCVAEYSDDAWAQEKKLRDYLGY